MTKYASCLKIRADTRILNGAWQDIFCNKNIRVPAIGEELLARHHESEIFKTLRVWFQRTIRDWVLHTGGVCLVKKNTKICEKNSRFQPFCPLILVTKGGPMINNMVLSREIEWIGYEHKRNMLQVEFIVGAIYQYENVPETVYQEFLTAPSHGRFFESNIKNKYHVRKVR